MACDTKECGETLSDSKEYGEMSSDTKECGEILESKPTNNGTSSAGLPTVESMTFMKIMNMQKLLGTGTDWKISGSFHKR
eukprot:3516086-Ditylum_brightwellii.AAC.1